ncbi:1-deoxy-D-xylulose-5-phosphate synthase, partial [Paenibacillus sp. MWE-103]
GPIALRYARGNGIGVKMDEELKEIPIGTWEVLREGRDAVILTFGTTIEMAIEAAENLAKQGKSIRVVNARFIKPLDENMLHEIFTEHIPVLTIEEAVLQGGFGSAVLEFAQENNYYQTKISRIGIPDRFIEHGSVSKLLEEIGMTTENVITQLRAMIPENEKKELRS